MGEIEDLRRLPDDLAAELAGTGLGRAWAPARYGGAELPGARGAGRARSTGLVRGRHRMVRHDRGHHVADRRVPAGALGGGRLRRPAAPSPEGTPPRSAELAPSRVGWWSPATGSGGRARRTAPTSAAAPWWWTPTGRPAARPDGLRTPFVLFEPGQVELQDTWYTVGLRGRAARTTVVVEAFVPEGRWVEIVGQDPVVQAPLYRFPFFGALALGISAICLGLARRALDELAMLAVDKRYASSTRPMAAARRSCSPRWPGPRPVPLGPSAPPGDRRRGVGRRRRRPLPGPRNAQAPAVRRHHCHH